MSHKVHPKAYRIRRIGDWDTRGFYKSHAEYLEEDFKIREYIDKKLKSIGIEKIEIERFATKVNIIISSARPGLIIGRGGEGVELLKKELEDKIIKSLKKSDKKQELRIEIREIKDLWTSASLSAQAVAQQIEKRMPYRRVLKQSLSKIMTHKDIKGARIKIAGRLNGVEIARREWVGEGQLPRQTIRADIDYAQFEANCSYGVIGVKVWIYKGEKFD
ncbi:30S ribosomal protein S3 [Patescibacteria group bacterium]|nr:30S ribosomal protein S3 [Patescibacteria group bacterium]